MVDADLEEIERFLESLSRPRLASRPSAASTCCFVGAPVARVTSRPCSLEHQRGRGAQDPEPAYDVEVVLGVDLEVRDARQGRGDVLEDPARRAAGRAEGRGELEQRRPLAEARRPRACPRAQTRGSGCCGLGTGAGSAPWTRWVPRKRPSVSARNSPKPERADDGDEEDLDTGAHAVAQRLGGGETLPDRRAQPPAKGGRNSTVDPGCDHHRGRVVGGDGPVADHHRAAREHVGEARRVRVGRSRPPDQVRERDRTGDLERRRSRCPQRPARRPSSAA